MYKLVYIFFKWKLVSYNQRWLCYPWDNDNGWPGSDWFSFDVMVVQDLRGYGERGNPKKDMSDECVLGSV
jgi:hypothetical protein